MPFPLDAAGVPRNLHVENTLMRRPKRFDYCITRRGPSFGLQALLKQRLEIGIGGAQRVGPLQLAPQRVTNKTRSSFETAIQKNRARYCLKHVRQQSILLPPTTLLFTTSEP